MNLYITNNILELNTIYLYRDIKHDKIIYVHI